MEQRQSFVWRVVEVGRSVRRTWEMHSISGIPEHRFVVIPGSPSGFRVSICNLWFCEDETKAFPHNTRLFSVNVLSRETGKARKEAADSTWRSHLNRRKVTCANS